VGSGFGGILAAIKLKQRGIDVRVFERETSLGGTWNLNT
jgi:cation diffusion facilitator CzcD-associated flavoprotein CzcO